MHYYNYVLTVIVDKQLCWPPHTVVNTNTLHSTPNNIIIMPKNMHVNVYLLTHNYMCYVDLYVL